MHVLPSQRKEPYAPSIPHRNADILMKDTDAGNENIATDIPDPVAQPNALNRRDVLVGTAGVVALTAAITAQTSAAAQAPSSPAPVPAGPGAAQRPAGPPGSGRGAIIPAGSV